MYLIVIFPICQSVQKVVRERKFLCKLNFTYKKRQSQYTILNILIKTLPYHQILKWRTKEKKKCEQCIQKTERKVEQRSKIRVEQRCRNRDHDGTFNQMNRNKYDFIKCYFSQIITIIRIKINKITKQTNI